MRPAWVALWKRLGALLRRGRLERDLDEEIAFHRAMLAEKGAGGRRFGNEVRLREAAREAWMFTWLESLGQDLRYAARGLRRAPGFALGVVLTLALGIGANSAIFSLAYGILWKPLPYPDAEHIVEVRQARGAMRNMMNSSLDVTEARGQNTGLTAWAMYRGDEATLTGAGDPTLLDGGEIEAGVLAILGAKPVIGRLFTDSDDHANAPPVVLISARLWRERWNARPNLVGQMIQLQDKPYTVVGVLPDEVQFPAITFSPPGTAFWLPWREAPEGAGNRDVGAIARLAPGVTLVQAQTRLNIEMQHLAAAHSPDQGWSFALTPLREQMVGKSAPALWMMLAVVGFVLLIAAANVACLLLARAQRRERELATRAALGASRGRILRQLGTETAVLIAAGAGAGLALAALGIAWLRAAAPSDLPRLDGVGMNWTVIGFTATVALAVGLVFGLGPALAASGHKLDATLRPSQSARGGSHGRGRGAWVVAQVALSLLLLVGAGLLLKALDRKLSVPLGFNPKHTLTFWLSLPDTRYPDLPARQRFYIAAEQRLAALPGVQSAAAAGVLPLNGFITTGYSLPGHPPKPNDDSQETGYSPVSASYFPTMRIPVLAGRGLLDSDTATAPAVMVINHAMARAVFPGVNPVGQRIRLSYGRQEPWRTVVGVVGDVQTPGGDKPTAAPACAYVPIPQIYVWDEMAFLLRTTGDPIALTTEARHAVLGLDKQMPLAMVEPMDKLYANAVAEPRFRGYLVAGFAALALLLTAVGVYGVLSYSVGGRTQEFGVRAALGARPEQVLAMVLRQALALLGLGLALGLGAALLLSRYLAGLLFGVSPTDPWVLAATILLLAVVGLAAAWAPGRRAMAVDPARALRCD